ncbi:hypothetical protein AV530_000671 [Patagioenas fasciata monilis]|uniref:Uncharacterized protein n=1 Tax=Patagioenas fasciata monilis TaxID=372326 RepID=A0A1V4IG85_PATFA|nr:hypothetical protein AV530_000671 [Patagioenas fasciata monilis]
MRSRCSAMTATVLRDMMMKPELVRWKVKQKAPGMSRAEPKKRMKANMGAATPQMKRSQKERLRIMKSKLVLNFRRAGSKKDRSTMRLP